VLFAPTWDFREFHDNLSNNVLIYANPMDSLRLFRDFGYRPLAHPAGVFDEIVFVTGESSEYDSVTDMAGRSVASVASMLPTSVALGRLQRSGIEPSRLEDKDSWMAVVSDVINEKIEFGFVYKDFYEGLNESTQAQLKMLEVTDEREIYHMVLASPELSDDLTRQTLDALLVMHETSTGRKVSEALGFSHFVEVEKDQMNHLEHMTKALRDIVCGCDQAAPELAQQK